MFKFISKFILQMVGNGVGILAIAYLVDGASFHGSWLELLEISVVLALINVLVRPILKLVLGPLILLTFGLFGLVINGAILWATTWIFPQYLEIPLGWPLVLATIVITAINSLFALAKRNG